MINSESFKDIFLKADKAHKEIINCYPSLPPADPRLATGAHIRAVLSSVYLMTIHFDDNLQDLNWWQKRGLDTIFILPNNHHKELDNYLLFIGWAGLITYPFSHFEAGIRQIARELHPNNYSYGTASFESIYKSFLSKLEKKGWKFSLGDSIEFLELYRETRNTIHNNAVFFSPKGENKKCTWRGKEYHFKHKQTQDFRIDHCIMLVEDLIVLNLEIMKNTILLSDNLG
jgi:hypothetical protein